MAIREAYELEKSVNFVIENGFKKVALQFPDELLSVSASVANLLINSLPSHVSVFILADSSYSPLSVDRVAAQHLQADCLIHYGRASFTEVDNFPVLYVLQRRPLSVQAAANALGEALGKFAPESRIQIFVDQLHIHQFSDVKEATEALVKGKFQSVAWPILNASTTAESNPPTQSIAASELTPSDRAAAGNEATAPNRRTEGYGWTDVSYSAAATEEVEDSESADSSSAFDSISGDLTKQVLVWLGASSSPALETLQLCSKGCQWVVVDTSSAEYGVSYGAGVRIDRMLKRRYFLVEKARQANIVGILVGTLAAAGYLEVVRALHRMARRAGKRAYTFLVGKPSPAKLANFPEVDVFVHVAVADGLILESREYLAPVVGAYEAALAFLDLPATDRVFNPDFEAVLELERKHNVTPLSRAPEEKDAAVVDSRDEARGECTRDAAEGREPAESGQQVAALMRATELLNLAAQCPSLTVTAYSAAEYLHLKRSYKGLEMPAEKLAPAIAVDGLAGRAAVYDNDQEKIGERKS